MDDSWDDIADDESCYESYGDELELEGVGLPNFKDAREIDGQRVLRVIDANLPSELNYRGYIPTGRFSFGFDELELQITVDLQRSSYPITTHVENYELQSRRQIDAIRWSLRESVANEVATCEKTLTIFDSGLIVLRLLEEITGYVQEYRKQFLTGWKDKTKYWDLTKTNNINILLDPKLEMKGVDLDSIQGAATGLLGRTPAQICNDILPDWRILHCENILRQDLLNKFLQFQEGLRERLMDESMQHLKDCVPREFRRSRDGIASKEQLVEYLTQVRTTFHGTRREVVPSIVQHGFLKPGDVHPLTKKALPIFNGSVYGQGIYTSPEASYALLYSEGDGVETKPSELPGLKLIVCAAVMGRTACLHWGDLWQDQTEPYPKADSHVNDSLLAYIAFNSAQVLPCYVLHLDWVGKSADDETDFVSEFLARYSNGPLGKRKKVTLEETLMPGDKQRKKQELIAKGQKFFAYGFGPVDGRKLVIEDVAEIDDDEEDYGEFQAARMDTDSNNTNTNIWGWGKLEGETAYDEYVNARKSRINRRNPDVGES
ncbi:hypothetical protein K505DRAFT_361264 [Melanomma pulvis-pyrius CBS 109.77]|uniref:PARP catalytic domain-containing protein n=1 Tax=Melanomma pulvis-pyrius CBS 109.77 TaxID=1314802 RepID=A0A6A6XDS0_9PLEO|nr:hypothetical protein K505DRAFT_361264 [Melanomma pulvis-pyrius CBS 109.77]